MDTELPEDIRLLQRTVRGFVDDVLAPCAKEIEEKDEIPRDLIAKMGEAGLFGIGHDERWGGQGFGKLGYAVAVEQLSRVNASLWNVIGGSAGLCGTAISVGGPDELRERYLPQIFAAEKIGAYALSEPGAGSDAGTAVREWARHTRVAARRRRGRWLQDRAPHSRFRPTRSRRARGGCGAAPARGLRRTREDARAIRQADRREPGDPVDARGRRDRDPCGTFDGVRRRVSRRPRRAHHRSCRDGQAV